MGMFDFNFPKKKPLKIKPLKLSSSRRLLPRKRDTQRMLSNRRVREPLSAKVKNTVRKRARGKCEARGCNHSTYLDFHHKNMNSDDNRPSNIILLCPIHHREAHAKNKKITTRDVLGRETHSRIVSSKRAKQIKDERKKKSIGGLFYGKL